MRILIRLMFFFIPLGMLFGENSPNNPLIRMAQKNLKYFPGDTLNPITEKKAEDIPVIEKPIDPEKYIVGPGDVLKLSVISSVSTNYTLTISPDGRCLIPECGVVNLKDLTLKKAEEVILEKAKKTFKSDEIYLLLSDIRKFKVTVSGAVKNPGIYTGSAVYRVSEIIEKAGGSLKTASLRKIILLRDTSKINVDLLKYYMLGDNSANPTLTGGDHILVSNTDENEFIRIEGEVSLPGKFEYLKGDSLSSLVRYSQGFLSTALLDSVEIIRYNNEDNSFQTKLLDLSDWSDPLNFTELPNDIPLETGDRVYIRKKTNFIKDKYVILKGEFVYPGYYAINEGQDDLISIINKAGGFTEDAALEKAVMIRQSDSRAEDPVMRRLRAIPTSEMSENEKKYFQARESEIKGIMSIDFTNLFSGKSHNSSIVLMHEDSIYVPKANNYINVQGRVNNPGNVAFKEGLTYLDYIALAGGFGFRADEDATLIVKPKGQQYSADTKNYIITPGDYILVPPKSEVTFFDIFTQTLTITTQIVTIFGVLFTIIRLN